MSPQTSNEPSLEEILASIRQIISEDGPAAAAAATAAPRAWSSDVEADDDVLVLTRRVPMNGYPFLHAKTPDPQPLTAPVDVMAAAEHPLTETVQPNPQPEAEPVVDEETEFLTASAFDKLETAAREPARPQSILMPAPGRTLEDVIRDLMQPLIKEWLDENLADIVRARVDEEVERIARRRVR